jgi:hypothetical protein
VPLLYPCIYCSVFRSTDWRNFYVAHSHSLPFLGHRLAPFDQLAEERAGMGKRYQAGRNYDQNRESVCGRLTARLAANAFQNLVESVQLVAEVTESDLFCPQLLLGLYFSRLQLLFLVF